MQVRLNFHEKFQIVSFGFKKTYLKKKSRHFLITLTFIKESVLRWKRLVYSSRKIPERNDKLLMMTRSKRGLEREGEGGEEAT